ncbi:hypothetical protein [Xenorhabdus sp. IM139775]|uniref:hypothetical protein n=1 Tax=Xenorhabdus sp. IM139775 TaxID=3025876 RepID=UPI0023590209|nr:hypothetical protein [Xenorhabdus sp. IM139775]MDC9593529.1 hypothetical protein [Xenorhabdus sp. IM139775]
MALDHGVLNVPLHKRGNIDREIDKWKNEQVAEKRQRLDEINYQREQERKNAEQLFKLVDRNLMKNAAKRVGMSLPDYRLELKIMVQYRPKQAEKILAKLTRPENNT